ncbi:Gfo/Idh/MocA family protein [Paenibacillus abyssi]|uniref:Dehydrogenase n=1 Tax=Paenibacillus abyssi TaxID=1340531 RepID=A0A917CYV4_9BACL|nr:Gfo/Idh/MocA family oxidoreductase [Paenibacillus abyssi]GGG02888.1 dehydrogenase [Paenibacillus abyssi]
MNTIKVGIIGTGFAATSHIEALRRIPGVIVWGVAASSRSKGNDYAEKMNIPHVYDSSEALIADPAIDAVHNCTPNSLHYEINKQALLAGKHVLSEKPLATNAAESSELAKIAKRQGVSHGVCFNYRHYPMVAEAKEMIQAETNGRVMHVQGCYMQDWLLFDTDYSWRLDPAQNGLSRAIADIGSHWCDTIQHVLNKKIVEVCADLKTVHPTRKKPKVTTATFASAASGETEEISISTEDYGSVLIHFEDGVQGVFTVSQVAAGRKNRLYFEVAAERSAIAWDQEQPNQLWIGKRCQANEVLMKDPEILSPRSAAMSHYPGGHQEGWPDGLKNLCMDFYENIDHKKRSGTYANFSDGHQIVQLNEAILLSHQERRWVQL